MVQPNEKSSERWRSRLNPQESFKSLLWAEKKRIKAVSQVCLCDRTVIRIRAEENTWNTEIQLHRETSRKEISILSSISF